MLLCRLLRTCCTADATGRAEPRAPVPGSLSPSTGCGAGQAPGSPAARPRLLLLLQPRAGSTDVGKAMLPWKPSRLWRELRLQRAFPLAQEELSANAGPDTAVFLLHCVLLSQVPPSPSPRCEVRFPGPSREVAAGCVQRGLHWDAGSGNTRYTAERAKACPASARVRDTLNYPECETLALLGWTGSMPSSFHQSQSRSSQAGMKSGGSSVPRRILAARENILQLSGEEARAWKRGKALHSPVCSLSPVSSLFIILLYPFNFALNSTSYCCSN